MNSSATINSSFNALAAGSAAIDVIPASVSHPSTDFFGNSRPDHNSDAHFDIGAVEYYTPGPFLPLIRR